MRVAPFRALTHQLVGILPFDFGRNAGRPFQGIDTLPYPKFSYFSIGCRNAGRPFQGIDTVCRFYEPGGRVFRRNAGRPFQGIDTSLAFTQKKDGSLVEMRVAPFRALTQKAIKLQNIAMIK